MLHPHTRLAHIDGSPKVSVVSTQPIPRGTVVWCADSLDQRLKPAAVEALPGVLRSEVETRAHLDRYGFRVLFWDARRFLGHSCEAAVLSPGVDLELAVRDIAPDALLTCDYTLMNHGHGTVCECGSPLCRGVLDRDDFHQLVPEWDRRLRNAVRHALRVEQPLGSVMREPERLERWANEARLLPSSAQHRFPPDWPNAPHHVDA